MRFAEVPLGMAVRNPLVGIFVALAKAAILAPILSLPIVLFGFLGLPMEVALFYEVAAFAIAGAFAGRSGTFGWAAFPAAFLGGFFAYVVFNALAAPPMYPLYALIHATIAGGAAWAAALHRMAKVTPELRLESEELRKCRSCGARVGSHAHRCWSCRATLSRLA